MTVRWTVRAAEDRARSSRENRVLVGPPSKTPRHQSGFLFCLVDQLACENLVSATLRSGNRFAFPAKSASSLLVSGKSRNIASNASNDLVSGNAALLGGFFVSVVDQLRCGLRPPDRLSRRLHNQAKASLWLAQASRAQIAPRAHCEAMQSAPRQEPLFL